MLVLRSTVSLLLGLALACLPQFASTEELRFQIVGAGANQIPIAVAPLVGEGLLPEGLTNVVRADLERSGLFRMIDASAIAPRPADAAQVNFAEWRDRGAQAMVIGRVEPAGAGRWEIQFRLLDVARGGQLLGKSYPVESRQLRATAHRIADEVFEQLTGIRGVFSTRIAYVTKAGKRFQLMVADADGYNPRTVVTSSEPIMSPRWSPDGSRIAYVSFEAKKPIVYVQVLNTGQRIVVANLKGSNSAPAWSPDGRQLAVVLTRDGSSQIYLVPATGGHPERLMRTTPANDTEPFFSADGRFIYFTSDRGGGPQVYRVAPQPGSTAERLTFEGDYNAVPRPSPDGRSLAFVQRSGGRFRLTVQDLGSRQVLPLTDGPDDDSPSWAPNGQMILFGRGRVGQGELAAISVDGRVRQRLSVGSGDVREPAWGPFGP